MDALQGILSSFTPEEKAEAKTLQEKIDQITETINREKKSLESNFVTLSSYINEVRSKKYWLLSSFKTFGDYLESIEKKFQVGKSQLYVYMNTTRNLLPSMGEQDLVDIGISKAKVLSKYVEQSGQSTIPDDILDTAKDKSQTVEQLDAAVNARLHNVTPDKGQWMTLGGFFVTEDERKEITDAVELARSIDPVIPNTIPHWQQLKEAYLRLAREFIGAWSGGRQ